MKKSNFIWIALFASIFGILMVSCNRISQKNRTGNYTLDLSLQTEKSVSETEMNNIVQIIKKRLIAYGINEESITISSSNNEISVNVKEINEPERVSTLITTTGKLEFWETWNTKDIYSMLINANKRLAEIFKNDTLPVFLNPGTSGVETSTIGQETDTSSLSGKLKNIKPADNTFVEYSKENPLFAFLQLNVTQDENGNYILGEGPKTGYSLIEDTTKINYMISVAKAEGVFRNDLKFKWSYKTFDDAKSMLELIAVKTSGREDSAPIDGSFIAKAYQDTDPSGNFIVTMEMTSEGASIWKKLTSENIGKNIALIFDDFVYSYPVILAKIENGHSQISGNFTKEEAEDMATILTLGKLPCKLKIINSKIEEK